MAVVWKHELFLLYSGNHRGGEKFRVLCSYDTVLDKLSHQDMVWDIDSKVILAKVHFLLKLKVELRILEFFLVINKKKQWHNILRDRCFRRNMLVKFCMLESDQPGLDVWTWTTLPTSLNLHFFMWKIGTLFPNSWIVLVTWHGW